MPKWHKLDIKNFSIGIIMNNLQTKELSEVLINSMEEKEYSHKLQASGRRIVCNQGRYWKETVVGFYEPLHWLARLTAEQATCPVGLSWGFRAALCENDAGTANGSIPVHLLPEIADYDEQYLPTKRRTDLRKCRKVVKFVQLTGPLLLQEQGYEVLCSSLARTGHHKPPSKQEYLAKLEAYTTDKHRLVLAALIDGKLGGYIDGLAIDGSAYMLSGYYATEALSTSMVTGFNFEFVQVCRRSGGIREVIDGLHIRERPALDGPKASMGFPVKYVPAKVFINPIVDPVIRRTLPHKYYRLTGKH
jgi:hypothetical protein